MTSTTTVTLVDGVRVVVPDSLDLITPYVLLEQQDWFEDEIKFLRRLLQPGQKVIDVGANYGVYALSMARTVGPTGCVWAFEPASSTARLLAEGIAVNGFAQVVLERGALSSAPGAAQLSLDKNPELNALVHGASSTGASETVPVSTLDACLERHGWRDIAFIKIDAEGEEANILKGGRQFFSELSPLVQYEINVRAGPKIELVQDFAALGYDSYRLVPGLNLLVAFNPESAPDAYLLNLFCCKRDRIERLAAKGLLLDSPANAPAPEYANAFDWRQTIAKLPYGVQLADRWEQTMAAGKSSEVAEALTWFAISRDSSLPPGARFGALEASFKLLMTLCEREPSYLRLASLARVGRDYGARSIAVIALRQLSDAILQHNRVHTSEPFLAPGERFDSVPPGAVIGNWVLAGILEEFERLENYSSFYNGISARQRLENIRDLGFGSEEMDRRLLLLQKRFGLPTS